MTLTREKIEEAYSIIHTIKERIEKANDIVLRTFFIEEELNKEKLKELKVKCLYPSLFSHGENLYDIQAVTDDNVIFYILEYDENGDEFVCDNSVISIPLFIFTSDNLEKDVAAYAHEGYQRKIQEIIDKQNKEKEEKRQKEEERKRKIQEKEKEREEKEYEEYLRLKKKYEKWSIFDVKPRGYWGREIILKKQKFSNNIWRPA